MLLNIFFDNMNAQLELFLIGAFIFGIYWFILRKYNSLGLRLFVLSFLLFIGCCVWVYKDEVRLKNTLENGEEHTAKIIAKATVGNADNEVKVSFTDKQGELITAETSTYVSKEEWEAFETGEPLAVVYVPETNETFVQESLVRFKGDKIVLYYFAGFWLVLGVVLLIWLRNYKVGVDEHGNEWVERPDGGVMFDERKSGAARAAKRLNILSKMTQAFER